MNNIPCRCGHLADSHYLFGTSKYCYAEIVTYGKKHYADKCMNYVPDNLKLIENIYDEQEHK